MRLDDALFIEGLRIDEMALANVTNKVSELLGEKDFDRLRNVLDRVDAGQIGSWTDQEKQDFQKLLNSSSMQAFMKKDDTVKEKIESISKKIAQPVAAAPAQKQPPAPPAGLSPDAKNVIAGMQKKWFALDPNGKTNLVQQWVNNPKSASARYYYAGLKSGYFK